MKTEQNKAIAKPRNNWKHVISIILVVAMLIYVLPTLNFKEGWTPSSTFGVVWIAFALLIVAAHLHRLLRVDEEMEQRLRKIKREKYIRLEARLKGQPARLK
ncbi:hypothetical protein M5X06_26530 [Paenibacillus alvei]|uniref:Uncharacterized protein n=1 Tax=Paenibacillus alvei TaxID=44250 RepID=A0ABT4H0J0_PAEAL|nr:hypothetical protein [Paenibacillus alvei]MBG9737061.1 hypothetical protein [Paenibacillus alvei]MBG9742828.1 hypothetical protein [Paenibacillus alvei]MCY9579745.1 hypothetical protein [Paenibacillus alvei]MCY9586398.1 hypothetical protein [Paenibacillus alvei]MCY9762156.1 hypothetical protein [Paenibacillus alvei]